MKKQPKAQNKRKYAALFAALTLSAVSAFAAVRTLPTPPSSSYPDTESSVNVAVTNWPGLGRRVKLILSANFTPSNCVQIAFGQDTNADGDLAPEETHLVLGVDCGEPFARWEVVVGSRSPTVEWSNFLCTPTTNIYDFTFKQPSAVAKRVTHVKVTTRGRGVTAAEIAAKVTRPGAALILR